MKKIAIMAVVLLLLMFVVGGIAEYVYAPKYRLPSEVATALRETPSLTLFSLDPTDLRHRSSPQPAKDAVFHDRLILGKVNVTGGTKDGIRHLVDYGVEISKDQKSDCFNPHHGIRVETSSGIYDFLISIQCESIIIYLPDGSEKTMPISTTADIFDGTLSHAGVPLSKN